MYKGKLFNDKNTKIAGFWTRLNLCGSQVPVARENSSMVYVCNNFKPFLYLAGGSPLISGSSPFELYRIQLDKLKWERIQIPRNIVTPLGSRPDVVQDGSSDKVKLLLFSGQQPPQRLNEGIKICTVDFLSFDTQRLKWKRIK